MPISCPKYPKCIQQNVTCYQALTAPEGLAERSSHVTLARHMNFPRSAGEPLCPGKITEPPATSSSSMAGAASQRQMKPKAQDLLQMFSDLFYQIRSSRAKLGICAKQGVHTHSSSQLKKQKLEKHEIQYNVPRQFACSAWHYAIAAHRSRKPAQCLAHQIATCRCTRKIDGSAI